MDNPSGGSPGKSPSGLDPNGQPENTNGSDSGSTSNQPEQSTKRKRGRTDSEAAAGGPSGSSAKPKFDAPDVASPCSVCGKQFASWKALFGHMRSHPDRQWRGVHPPPTFNREGSPENVGQAARGGDQEVAGYLLKLAAQVKSAMEKQQHTYESGGARPSSTTADPRKGLDFDLNLQPHDDYLDQGLPSDDPASSSVAAFAIDLNMPAPPDSDEDGDDE
ncbi:zinc finger protein ZAT3-like [Malania oleifera]|uniref:zinc finger protein ZAT3-like n=1 Tax=Malania oleifera TaxID=397392 RepID=UPI0025ADCC1C|nr:zinc finger protein ZAT3-like [Malania oleifera]